MLATPHRPSPAPALRRLLAGMLACLAAAQAGTATAQTVPVDAATAQSRSREISFSLFTLTNSGFTAGGYASYDDSSTTAQFSIYNLPLRHRFDTGLLGTLELRLTLGYGEARSSTLLVLDEAGGSVASQRSYISNWSSRLDLGRPIALTPQLTLTPMLGLGYTQWSGKVTSSLLGATTPSDVRVDFWANALLYDAIAILEYRQPWRNLVITPGVAVNYTYIDSFDGRGSSILPQGGPGPRTPVRLSGGSTLLRGAVRIDGPVGLSLGEIDLRWQTFVVGSYEASNNGLFPRSVEVGAALGAALGPVGLRLTGLDAGTLFLGASYIVGENLQVVRANFGFRF